VRLDLERRTHDKGEQLAVRGSDWTTLITDLTDVVGAAIPFTRTCWHTVDPGTVLFTGSVNKNISCSGSWLAAHQHMINDLDHKVVERFLATPASRFSIVLSQIVRSALTAAIQAVVILVVSLALGVHIHTGVLGWLTIILAAVLVNSAFAGISQAIALLTRREATMIAVANFIGLPLLFLSSTMIALKQMPGWMQTASKFNPVDWGVRAAREVVLPGTAWSSVAFHLLLLLGLSALTASWATWTFRSYQRSL